MTHTNASPSLTRIVPMCAMFCVLLSAISYTQDTIQPSRVVVPLREFVSAGPFEGSEYQESAPTITKDDAERLVLIFGRQNLPPSSGPQFIRINTSILDKRDVMVDHVTQFAFTFPPKESPQEDYEKMVSYARQILQFGYLRPGRSDSIRIEVDTLPDWGHLRIEVVPDEEYTRYTSRKDARIVWHYRIQGPWLDSKFTLGIPKVIYDTQSQDTVDYGNASALLRFFYINQRSGDEFPVSLGFGLYGVSTPLDVSSRGGGVVLSLYFDVVQFLRVNGLQITDKANAGLEIVPFLPIDKKPRVLLSARIGFTP